MALLDKQITHMGPLLRLQWRRGEEPLEETKARGTLWIERGVLERLKSCLVPMAAPERPPEKAQVHPSPCWVWTGPVSSDGRAMIYNQDRAWQVNRLLYTIQHGLISERTLLYSACGVPRCCNPMHQQAIDSGPIARPSPAMLKRRYPRCKRGHLMTPENSYTFQGKIMCRDCRAQAQSRYRQRVG